MERQENGAQAPGICDRLFSFILDGIVFRGLKRVTLGRPVEDNTISGTTKHTGESSIHNLSTKESLVERANKMYRSFPIATIGSSVQVQMSGTDRESEEEFFEVETPSPRMIPLGGEQNGVRKGAAASPMNAQGLNSMRLQQSPAKDGAKQMEMEKKKGKKAPKKEKPVLSPVLENDVKVRSPTPMIPIISHAFDIDRRSDELIRRTREALRNSAKHS